MKDKIQAVKEFHKAFKLDYLEQPKANIGLEKNKLRFNLMREENEEYLEAANNNDIIEVADALGDMLYILCGTIIEHGMQHKIDEIREACDLTIMDKEKISAEPRRRGPSCSGPSQWVP